MPSFDDRQSSVTDELQLPGQVSQFSPVEQLPFPSNSPFARSTPTSLRQPIVIRGTGKKSSGIARPPKGRRWVISASVVFLMMLISLGTAMAVAPAGGEGGHSFNPFQFVSNLVKSSSSNPSLVAQQT